MQELATLFVLGIIFWGFIVSAKEENKLIQDYSNKSGNDYYKNQNNKGILGEFLLFKKLQKLLFEKEFLLNLYLPRSDDFNKNTEIDLIMICEKGIYVFEFKNFKGWIFGSEFSERWCQGFRTVKYYFYNPIMQNKGHIEALKKELELPDKFFKSFIVFGNDCNFKQIPKNNNHFRISYLMNINKIIEEDYNCSERILGEKDIKEIKEQLEKFSLVGENIKKEHINSIKGVS